jgi:hypothetical protein
MNRHPLLAAVEAAEPAAHADLATMDADQRSVVTDELLATMTGRRWLRDDPALTTELADRLLAVESDFREPRRDRSLARAVERASATAVGAHLNALAAGPAATALWRRLSAKPETLAKTATALVASDDAMAAEATLHLLVLDPLDPFAVGNDDRLTIAASALNARASGVRGLAAEFLAEHAPELLERRLQDLLSDESERVRGVVWGSALRVNRQATVQRATTLLADESAPVVVRRSALNALGATLSTPQIADVLSYFVIHPDHELAADAANLLYRLHRNPSTAEAARDSPHADVREVAEQLLDPLRGSPAAGGSRPGDPTRSSADIYADMIRQLEEKVENRTDQSER